MYKVYSMEINKLIESETVVVLTTHDEEWDKELRRLEELGIQPSNPISLEPEEKIVKYSCYIRNLTEVRQSYVEYKGELVEGVIVTSFGNNVELWDTPILLIRYKEFMEKYVYEKVNKDPQAK